MAYQKLQVSQALPVIISDTVHIPDPSTEVLTGTADFTGGNLVDVGTTFLSDGIQTNAIVYNTTANIAYYVTEVVDDLTLTLSPASAGGASDAYVIYNRATIGAVLYIGEGGNIAMLMAAKKDAPGTVAANSTNFTGFLAGSFLPTQVVGVAETGPSGFHTTASGIIALW